MGCRRCTLHDWIKLPPTQGHCPVCGEPTMAAAGFPDRDWQQKARDAQTAAEEGDEWEQVCAWRLRQLLNLEVPLEDAEALARQRDLDWHRVAALVQRGCPPHMAARIFA